MSQTYREIQYQKHGHQHSVANMLAALTAVLGSLVALLLVSRFVLSLLEVDRMGEIARFIYSASYPLVAPFFSLLNYQQQMGVMRVEYQTLVAALFYGLATWLIAYSLHSVPTETNE